jgi:hypothetical protein
MVTEEDGDPPGIIWNLSNAFTSAFKQLDPIPAFKATVKDGRIPGSPALMGVLACGAAVADHPFPGKVLS